MASPGARFSRPSTTAFATGAAGALSVGLISGGLWYDSHRSAESVDRAREQVTAGQSAQLTPEPVVATTSERPAPDEPASEQPAESTSGQSTEGAEEPSESSPPAAPVQQWSAAEQPVEVPYVAPATSAPTVVAARRAPAVAAQPVRPAPAAAQPAGDDTARKTTTPDSPVLEVTQPDDAGFVPLPGRPGLLPFLPQANPAPQAPAAVGQAPAAAVDAAADAEG